MWIARDERGELNMFTEKPVKVELTTAPWVDNEGNNRTSRYIYDCSRKGRRYELSRDKYVNVTYENSPKKMVIKDDFIEFACDLFSELICDAIDPNQSDIQYSNRFREELEWYIDR